MLEITSIAADLMKIFAQRKYNANRYDDTTVTPHSMRLRKILLNEVDRKRAAK